MTVALAPIRTSLLVLAYFAFISLGLPDGLFGVGWPSMAAEFGVSTETAGVITFAGICGYFVSSASAGFILNRFGVGWLLAASTVLAASALAGYALSPALAVVVPCSVVAGFGGGAIDSGLNAYAAGAFGPRHMNWLHAFFGLGVALGPLIMTAALSAGLSWRVGYGVVAVAQFALAAAFAVTARSWRTGSSPSSSPEGGGTAAEPVKVRSRETFRLPATWLSVAAFVLYVSLEVAAGLWAFLLLTRGRGMDESVAGVCVSVYWAMLFVGRLVQGVVSQRFGAPKVLLGSLVGMAVGAVLVAVPGSGWIAAVGLAVIGFAEAPVFPLLMLTTADRVGAVHADRVIGLQVAAGALGGTLIPAGVGVLLSRVDLELLGPSLVVLAVALVGTYLVMVRPSPGR
ncbi:MFS transporter [Virgisporangium aliadipatigenens]|uniref:MFS transporter n=1 Tax=Virgisporangium aliadipatigenens TaxID=741659 RepID=A0A8J3YRY5_9ACTN|nr:MFS transporter [Virgisporangium aliadipatigenens]GIJ48741.1 MFS transporter [Virgisporangium aliadipatigenens]